MKRKIQMFRVAFIDNESNSKHLNFPPHGSWDQRPPCGAALNTGPKCKAPEIGKSAGTHLCKQFYTTTLKFRQAQPVLPDSAGHHAHDPPHQTSYYNIHDFLWDRGSRVFTNIQSDMSCQGGRGEKKWDKQKINSCVS